MKVADILRTLANNLEHAEGRFDITIGNFNNTGSGSNLAETLVINFAIIKVS
jgi:hypothetical protein